MTGPRVTRRSFLSLAGSGAALSALAGLRVVPARAQGEPAGTPFFEPSEREILTRVVERMVDTGEPDAPPVRETGTLDTIDRLCGGLDPGVTAPLPWLLRLVEWGPWLFELTPARFSKLPAPEQDRSLHGWMTSRFALRRQGFLALRNLALLGWYAQPETWPLVGYRGPLL